MFRFPEPLFDNEFEVLDSRPVGDRHLSLNLRIDGRREPLSAIHFGGGFEPDPPTRLHLAYQLELDDFRGRRGVRLLIRQRMPANGTKVTY